MYTDKICFEIADIVFEYVYCDGNVSLSDQMVINRFLKTDIVVPDVTNYIYQINTLNNILSGNNDEPLLKTKYWSMFPDGILFHMDNECIAVMKTKGSFHIVETYIKEIDLVNHPLPLCVTGFLLQRLLAENKSELLFHGAAIGINNKTIVLSGNSGAGKSTLSAIFRNHANAIQICDDRCIITKKNDGYYVHGNPLDFKMDRGENTKQRIDYLLFLHHGIGNRLEHIETGTSAMKSLFKIAMLPYAERTSIGWAVNFLCEMSEKVGMFDFYFVPEYSSAEHILINLL
jgi:hypothetical protein